MRSHFSSDDKTPGACRGRTGQLYSRGEYQICAPLTGSAFACSASCLEVVDGICIYFDLF